MNVKEEIQNAIKNGIAIDTNNDREDDEYRQEMLEFLIRKGSFCIMLEEEKTIVVSSNIEDIADIIIFKSSVFINPLSADGFFKVFMDMLEFIAKNSAEQLAKEKIEEERNKITIKDEDLEWL